MDHPVVNREQNEGRRWHLEWWLTFSSWLKLCWLTVRKRSEYMSVCVCVCVKIWVKLENLHVPIYMYIRPYIHIYIWNVWYFPKCLHIHNLLKSIQQSAKSCITCMCEINYQDVNWLTHLTLWQKSWNGYNSGLTLVIFLRSYYWDLIFWTQSQDAWF